MVSGQEILCAKIHVADVTPLAELCKYFKCLFGDADHSFGPSCFLFHRVMKMPLQERVVPWQNLLAQHPACQSPPKRLLYSNIPYQATSLRELLETEKPHVFTNYFIYSVTIADSLVAYVLVPTDEFGSHSNLPIRENLPSRVFFTHYYQSPLPLV